MRPLLIAILAVSLVGCSQFKKLTGTGDDRKDPPADINGVWEGSIDLDGRTQNINFILVQDGGSIISDSIMAVDWTGSMSATVRGSVTGSTFSLQLDEGSACVNKFTASGEVNGRTMVIRLVGQGNNVPGTVCYPKAIDKTLTLGR